MELRADLEKIAEVKNRRLRQKLIIMAIGDYTALMREGMPDNKSTWAQSASIRVGLIRECVAKGWIDDDSY